MTSKYFNVPFANSGDKTSIPDAPQPSGDVSFAEGYTPDYEKDQSSDPDAKDVSRQSENYFKFVVTEAMKEIQELGGKPYSLLVNYPFGAISIGSDNNYYRCLVKNGPDVSFLPVVDPVNDTTGTWVDYNLPYANVADLRASLLVPSNKQTAIILGYKNPGDGGGQCVYWDSSSIEVDNGFNVFKLAGITTGRFKSINAYILTVRHAGAVSGATPDENRLAVQAVVDYYATTGGDVILPDPILISSTPGPDGLDNGVTVPFNGFDQDPKLRFIGIGKGGLLADDDGMILIRASTPGVEIRTMTLNGNGHTGVWAAGYVPEDRNQLVTLVSQSYGKFIANHVQGCVEGIVVEPGPTVAASQSGAFYPIIESNDFNLNTRAAWLKGSISEPTNRVTRANVVSNRIERGNVGLDLEYATETTAIGNNFQFLNASYTGPRATSCAIYLGAKTENTFIFGGAIEACTWTIDNSSAFTNNMVFGTPLTGVGNNLSFLSRHTSASLYLTQSTGVSEPAFISFKNTSFVKISADKTGSSLKDLSFETNGIERLYIFNGTSTFRDKVVCEQSLQVNNTAAIITSGIGSPEGVVTAVKGSLYTNTNGGAGTTLYVKEDDTIGNQGWVGK